MGTLQTALGLLQEQFGEFDNVKLLLSNHAGTDPEEVAQEILEFAEGIKSGEFVPMTTFPEPGFEGITIIR